MNLWILVGCLLNVALGVIALMIDSFSFLSSSPGYGKLFVPLKDAGLLQLGMAVWFFALFASVVGTILIATGRERAGAWLALVGGLFFIPIGLIQCKGALQLLDKAKEDAVQERLGPQLVSNQALATGVSRRMWVAIFDMGFGLLLALSALGLVIYTNFQHFYRRLPTDVPKEIFVMAKPGALSKSYLLVGILVLCSIYVAFFVWAALAAKASMAVSWKILTTAFLSGPTASLAFAFGIVLFLIGVSALRRPILQLHEHYFTIRPNLFSRRLYSLYKDISQIEEVDEVKVILHVPIDGKESKIKLPMKLADERKRRHVLNTFEKRRAAQQRMILA